MSVQSLRPRSISELLDHAFRLYRAHFLTFIGIAAVISLPFALISTVAQYSFLSSMLRMSSVSSSGPSSSDVVGIAISYGIIGLLSVIQLIVIQPLVTGALARAVDRLYRTSEPVGILEAYRIGWKALFSLLAVALLSALATFVAVAFAALLAVVPILLSGPIDPQEIFNQVFRLVQVVLVFGAMVFAFAIVSTFFAVRFLFNTQAIVLEGTGPIDGLRRSWNLSSGSFWRTLLIIIITSFVTSIIAVIPAQIIIAIGGTLLQEPQQLALLQTAGIFLQYLGQILIIPLQLIVYTLLYFDMRIRREGLDMEYAVPATVAHV